MILNAYKKYSVSTLFLTLFWLFLLWFPFFLFGSIQSFENQIITKFWLFIIIVVISVFFYSTLKDLAFTSSFNYFKMLMFSFLISIFFVFDGFLLQLFLFILIFLLFSKFKQAEKSLYLSFSIGIVSALIFFVNRDNWLFLFVVIFAIISYKGALTKDILTYIVGFILTTLLYAEVLFLIHSDWKNQYFLTLNNLFSVDYNFAKYQTISIFLWYLVGLLSFLDLVSKSGFFNIDSRLNIRFFLFFVIFVAIQIIITKDLRYLIFLSLPFSFSLEYWFFEKSPTRFKTILFYLLFLSAFAYVLDYL